MKLKFIFKHSIYKLQRRRFGSSRRPGERITLGGGGHGHYPLDYDYYDTGDDHNLIFYQHNSIGNYQHNFSNKYKYRYNNLNDNDLYRTASD